MLKNKLLKKVLKGTVFQLLTLVNKVCPKDDNTILIYANNERLSDNSLYLYNYLVQNRYNDKYQILISIEDLNNKFETPDNVKIISLKKGILSFLTTKNVFYSFGSIPIFPTDKQKVIQMYHGTPLKQIGKLSSINNGNEFYFNYVCAASSFFSPIMAGAFGCTEENVFINGHVRTDVFFDHNHLYDFSQYDKVLLFTPTFRKSKYFGMNDSDSNSIIPFFDSQEELDCLKNYLENKNMKLIIKLHPGQDLNNYEKLKDRYIEILSHKDFLEEGYDLYYLLKEMDGLITDYSSIYFDYLLLNRPIAFCVEDMGSYSENRGFVFENPEEYMPGAKLKNVNDFYNFLDSLYGADSWEDKRKEIQVLSNQYIDGNNTERLLKMCNIER